MDDVSRISQRFNTAWLGTLYNDGFNLEHADVIGTSFDPYVFGLSYDLLGSYNITLYLGIVLALFALIFGLLVKEPKQETIV